MTPKEMVPQVRSRISNDGDSNSSCSSMVTELIGAGPGRLLRFLAGISCVLAFSFVHLSSDVANAGTSTSLRVRVLHAHNQRVGIDPGIQELVKELGTLNFTGFDLKSEVMLSLEDGGTSRLPLPNGFIMTVRSHALTDNGMLRLELEVKELKFKTLAAIAEGATLAVGGPPFDNGVLILAVSRPKSRGLETPPSR